MKNFQNTFETLQNNFKQLFVVVYFQIMNRNFFLLIFLIPLLIFSFSKTVTAGISNEDLQTLHAYEDTLSELSDSIVNGSEQGIRQQACLRMYEEFANLHWKFLL